MHSGRIGAALRVRRRCPSDVNASASMKMTRDAQGIEAGAGARSTHATWTRLSRSERVGDGPRAASSVHSKALRARMLVLVGPGHAGSGRAEWL